jgi:hypothetical protein
MKFLFDLQVLDVTTSASASMAIITKYVTIIAQLAYPNRLIIQYQHVIKGWLNGSVMNRSGLSGPGAQIWQQMHGQVWICFPLRNPWTQISCRNDYTSFLQQ